jgi:hypothetical protein
MRRWLLLTVALAACSSFSSNEDIPPGDGGVEGAAPGPPPPPAPAAEGGDAAPVTPLCETLKTDSTVVFCNDFDSTPTVQPFGWDRVDGPANGFSITTIGKNGHGLQLSIKGETGVQLVKDGLFPPQASVRFEIDVNVVQVEIQYATLAGLHYAGAADEAEYGMGVFSAGTGVSQPRNFSTGVAAPGWHHLDVTITSGTPYDVKATIDGQVVTSEKRDFSGFGSVAVIAGLAEFAPEPTKNATIIFDNVVVRRLP